MAQATRNNARRVIEAPAIDLIGDGGFEGGTPWPTWTTQTSNHVPTPICNFMTCSNNFARAGGNWIWFGGVPGLGTDDEKVGQGVGFPASGPAILTFWMRVSNVTTPFTDTLVVQVDGVDTPVTFTEPTSAEAAYKKRTVNLSGFSNGTSHVVVLKFHSPDGNSSFQVDDIALDTTASTASNSSVSGRVLAVGERGLTNALVTLTAPDGTSQSVVTGRSGAFTFDNVESGRTYIISIGSQRFSYQPQTVVVNDNVLGLTFTPSQ